MNIEYRLEGGWEGRWFSYGHGNVERTQRIYYTQCTVIDGEILHITLLYTYMHALCLYNN